MGVLDKIKNALFEVEYVEVDEPPKKEKKAKEKEKHKVEEKTEEVVEKPIAKKIVLPGKKEDKVETLEEEELIDQDFESRPVEEAVKENLNNKFNYMDEDDFKVEEEFENTPPEIVKVIEDEKPKMKSFEPERTRRSSYSYQEELPKKEENFESHYGINKPSNLIRENKPYGMDKSLSVQVHEYGSYDRKEEKTGFKPSPIISPIYGILDKNYKKEDVVQKKEVRLSSGYSRGSLNVDAVRNKAYGDVDKKEEVPVKDEPITTFEVEEEEEENLLVDLSDEKDKPEVKEITMGDALEYFQDLGLEYNVDYVDASKEKITARRFKEEDNVEVTLKDNVEDTLNKEIIDEVIVPPVEEKFKTVEIKDESNGKTEVTLDDDDNLFDLIDSMYQDND